MSEYAFRRQPDGPCPEPCHTLKGGCNISGPSCDSETVPPPCGKKEAQKIVESENPSQPIEDKDYTIYSFRDSILEKSNIGRNIIDDYYFISSTIPFQNMNYSLAFKAINLTNSKVVPMLDKLLKSPGSNQILLDSDTRTELINFVNEVRTLSNDADFLAATDRFISATNKLENKSVSQIYQYEAV